MAIVLGNVLRVCGTTIKGNVVKVEKDLITIRTRQGIEFKYAPQAFVLVSQQ